MPGLAHWETCRVSTALLDALDPEQRAVVDAPRGPVCVLAGAGTGKTRAITHRIAQLVSTEAVPASQLLAVTFTQRAAGEMRGRLRMLGAGAVQARTFHGAALRQLSYFWPRAFGGGMPPLVETKVRLVAEASQRLGHRLQRTELRDVMSEIEWAKSMLLTSTDYPARAAHAGRGTPGGLEPEQVARVYAAYDEAKRRAGQLDFDDLLLLTAGAIEEHDDVAEEMHARYRSFVVDEYQDVTPLQQRVLDAWLGGRDELTVVGDAAQTIYSFTGASPQWLLDFPRRYPTATVVRLVRDYRSTPQVVELANKVLDASRSETSRARVSLVGQRAPGPAPRFVEYDDEPAEARAVVASITRLRSSGVPLSEIAVLYRINAQSEAYEAAFSAAGVPYLVRGGERFFERPEVREAVTLLRGAARALQDDAPVGLVAQVHEALAIRWRPEAPAAATARADAERWNNVAAVVRLAEDLAVTSPAASLGALVVELEERAANQHLPTVEGVTLASLHAAKGLEWDAVFLVGLAEGTLPLIHAESPEEIEEERRLLYVGVTRAREHLSLTWALARSEGGRKGRRPSRFLDGLIPTTVARVAPAEPRRAVTVPRCRICQRPLNGAKERKLRRCEDCPANVDDAAFERLRSWRLETSRAEGKPAYTVFTDLTLTAIAEQRPASALELAQIPGVGKAKLDKYAEDVLALLAEPA